MTGIPVKFICTLLFFFTANHLNAGQYRSAGSVVQEKSTKDTFRDHRPGGGELHRINPHPHLLCNSASRVHLQAALIQPHEIGYYRFPVINPLTGYPGYFLVRNNLSHLYPSHNFW